MSSFQSSGLAVIVLPETRRAADAGDAARGGETRRAADAGDAARGGETRRAAEAGDAARRRAASCTGTRESIVPGMVVLVVPRTRTI